MPIQNNVFSFLNTLSFWSKKPHNSIIVSRAKQYSGEYSKDLPYSRFYDYYHQTPSVKRNINNIHRRWMGSSMEVQSQNKVFDKLWESWNDTVNFVSKLKEACLDALITGTALFEKQYYGKMLSNIEHVPTKTLWRIYRDEFANKLAIWQLIDGDSKKLSPENMIIMTINNPERDAIGKSAMYAVAVPQKVSGKVDEQGNSINPERYLPSILDVKTRLNFAHMEIAEKHAKTRSFVSLKGMKNADRQKEIEKDLENEGSSKYITVVDSDVDIKNIEFRTNVSDERFLDDIDQQINQGTGYPGNVIDKGGEMGYASSQTPMQDLSQSIEDMQNDVSEMVQDMIFKPLCEQWELDYEQVKPKLIFNTFVEKITFEQLIKVPPTAPLADTEVRSAYKEFFPGMDDTAWKQFKKERDAMAQQQLAANGQPANKNPRPEIEKESPKPEKTMEYLLKNPSEFAKHVENLVEEKIKKAKEFDSYFAMPPTDGKPYEAPMPDITDPTILDRVKELLKNMKDGKIEEEEAMYQVNEISKEIDSVGYWIKELKAKHKDWKHDQIVAVAIKKSKEASDNCKWVTVRGSHICIQEGETLESAVKRVFGDEGVPKKPKKATSKKATPGQQKPEMSAASPGMAAPAEGQTIEQPDEELEKKTKSKTLNRMFSSVHENRIDRRLFGPDTNPESLSKESSDIAFNEIDGYHEPPDKRKTIIDSFTVSDEELDTAYIPKVAEKPTTTFDDFKRSFDERAAEPGSKPVFKNLAAMKKSYREQYSLQKGDKYTDYNDKSGDGFSTEKTAKTEMVRVHGEWYEKGRVFTPYERKEMYIRDMIESTDSIHRKNDQELQESVERFNRFRAENPDHPAIKKLDALDEGPIKEWNAKWDNEFKTVPSFFRGTKGVAELDNYLKTGKIGGSENKYKYVAVAASPSVSRRFSDGIILEFDGDSIRQHAQRVNYTASPAALGISQSINNAETMKRPMHIKYANELEGRLPEGLPVSDLKIKRIIVHDRWVFKRLGLTREEFEKKYAALTKNFIYADITSTAELFYALDHPTEAKTPFSETPEGKKRQQDIDEGKAFD